ncbi:MAG TPA: hypothetical protein VGO40_08125 [Longimicrobium sp.]|nr:hypothetical protein [Longimicrobium sp.]
MGCYYCRQEGIDTDEDGVCPHCSLLVCAPPSERADGEFHAEECGCLVDGGGCNTLVCERHLRVHAETKHGHSNPAECFPALWTLVSRSGVGGAAALMVESESPSAVVDGREARRAVNRFLNVALPSDALLRLADSLPSRLVRVDRSRDETFVRFGPEFYGYPTLERAAAVASREMLSAARALVRYPERVAWTRERATRGGISAAAQEWLASLLRRFGNRDLSGLELERSGASAPEIAAATALTRSPEAAAAVERALTRNPEVFHLEPAALAEWVAAPHAQRSGAWAEEATV